MITKTAKTNIPLGMYFAVSKNMSRWIKKKKNFKDELNYKCGFTVQIEQNKQTENTNSKPPLPK